MALQTGIGVSRLIFIVGAGYTGTILLKNGKLSDVLAEFQNLVKKHEKGGATEGDSDALAAQVRRLTDEMRRLATNNCPIIINGDSGQSVLASLVVPTAALGALGYGYMWWKGISFSDLMYVTKRSMATAVENLTKHLQHVSDALAATKKHLTQRIENLDDKLDDQLKLSKSIRDEVRNMSDELSGINIDLDELQKLIGSLDGRLLTMEGKQDVANAGVLYLCGAVNGKRVKLPESIMDQLKGFSNSTPSLMGLKEVVESLESGNGNNRFITDGVSSDGIEKVNGLKARSLTRRGLAIC